jgi:hypothetical protein
MRRDCRRPCSKPTEIARTRARSSPASPCALGEHQRRSRRLPPRLDARRGRGRPGAARRRRPPERPADARQSGGDAGAGRALVAELLSRRAAVLDRDPARRGRLPDPVRGQAARTRRGREAADRADGAAGRRLPRSAPAPSARRTAKKKTRARARSRSRSRSRRSPRPPPIGSKGTSASTRSRSPTAGTNGSRSGHTSLRPSWRRHTASPATTSGSGRRPAPAGCAAPSRSQIAAARRSPPPRSSGSTSSTSLSSGSAGSTTPACSTHSRSPTRCCESKHQAGLPTTATTTTATASTPTEAPSTAPASAAPGRYWRASGATARSSKANPPEPYLETMAHIDRAGRPDPRAGLGQRPDPRTSALPGQTDRQRDAARLGARRVPQAAPRPRDRQARRTARRGHRAPRAQTPSRCELVLAHGGAGRSFAVRGQRSQSRTPSRSSSTSASTAGRTSPSEPRRRSRSPCTASGSSQTSSRTTPYSTSPDGRRPVRGKEPTTRSSSWASGSRVRSRNGRSEHHATEAVPVHAQVSNWSWLLYAGGRLVR